MRFRTLLLLASCGAAMAAANAAPISWTTWSPSFTTSSSNTGSATGFAGGVGVSYSGELIALYGNYPSWNPPGTFDPPGANGPDTDAGGIRLYGGHTFMNTITFSSAVIDPYFTFWSLGSPSILASFVFNATPTLDAAGGSQEYGGNPISISGNTVSGMEGNGVVHFSGTFTSISWNNPIAEDYYMFTVGIGGVCETEGCGGGGGDGDGGGDGGGSGNPGVPEPMTLALFAMGLAGMAGFRRR